ncbi:hypothetical protein [Streptomyces sp. NBC_00140]|nr:hypothetical protein [Streptomyces sp. NBC_00140]
MPTLNRVPAMLRERDRRAAGELLVLSEQVRLLEHDRPTAMTPQPT